MPDKTATPWSDWSDENSKAIEATEGASEGTSSEPQGHEARCSVALGLAPTQMLAELDALCVWLRQHHIHSPAWQHVCEAHAHLRMAIDVWPSEPAVISNHSMSKSSKPQKLWAFWANTHGPWNTTPQQVKLLYGDIEKWWSADMNSDVEQIGLVEKDGYVCFAHPDKADVERFIEGFMACRELLRGFFE